MLTLSQPEKMSFTFNRKGYFAIAHWYFDLKSAHAVRKIPRWNSKCEQARSTI